MLFFWQQGRKSALVVLIILLIITGCQSPPQEISISPAAVTESLTSPSEQTIIETQPVVPTEEPPRNLPESTNTQEPTPEAIPTEQHTPAPTLSDWRDAPATPETISDRVIKIYKNGQALGRDPHSFSVIGDCQSIPYVFMGPFSRGELEPASSENHLWKAINTFNPSFKRWAVTARGGFTAASILNPLQADADLCKPGETPLTCEFRLNNPAFVFITLETWLDPESIDRYEVYLHQIVDTVIEQGAVPILLTKADSSELRNGTHVINPVIVRVAYENQVPLVNFWRAAQLLDNYGIDPDREGFHLSQAGYNLKNRLALRALYQVWTTVEGLDEPVVVETPPTPTATLQPTQGYKPDITLPDCPDGCVFFGTAQSQDGVIVSGGVFAYSASQQTMTQVLPEGFDLQDASNDGTILLANQENRLYKINLTDSSAELLTESFYFSGKQGAYWDEELNTYVFLDQEDPIPAGSGFAFNLFPASSGETLYFEGGQCSAKDFCQSEGVFKHEPGAEATKIDKFIRPVFSPDGSLVAYLNPDAATPENYYHIRYLILEETDIGAASRRVLYFPEETGFMVYPEVKAFAFSPASDKLFILYNVYSEYYRYSLRLQTYLWDLNTGILYDMGAHDGVSGSLAPRLVWSPEGEQVWFFLTDQTPEGRYTVSIYQTDLATGEELVLLDDSILESSDYFYITNLFWRE